MIAAMLLIPLCGAVLTSLAARRSERYRDALYLAEIIVIFSLAAVTLAGYLRGTERTLNVSGICGMGLSFRMDGFRCVYVTVASFMWLMTGILSRQYFAHYHNRTRYYLFNQLTLLGTLGIFMSDDLYTTFIFFEIMSLSSYPWVAHDETEGAMHAAATYLIIAVFGGMVTLMGLFMTWARIGSLSFAALTEANGRADMALPAALILVGFAAKAGLFPLYMWLPQAHPVAPAPASALLSGVLTKTGVFGMLLVSLRLMRGVTAFGNILLALGLTTMLLGALLALFSTNLKRILACSSMSQIGYITVGLSMACLLGEEGGGAASGAVMHMVNHSVLKLTLFMAAGVIYMNLHRLELNDIRGFGRGKPVLHAAFLLGSVGLAGVPLFNGYLGKTLIHEGILEYAHEIGHFSVYNVCEWVFLFAAGITTAYMLKIYIALFFERHPDRQEEFDRIRPMNAASAGALIVSMLLIPVLGACPSILEKVSRMSAAFTSMEGVENIPFFNLENLKGGAVSLAIGTLVYLLVVRKFLYSKEKGYTGITVHMDILHSKPAEVFLKAVDVLCLCVDRAVENPFILKCVPALGAAVSDGADHAVENPLVLRWIPVAVTALTRLISQITDMIALLLRRSLFHLRTGMLYRKYRINRNISFALGHVLDFFVLLLNITFYRHHPIRIDFTYVLAARVYDRDPEYARVTRTVSFGLLMFAVGLLVVLCYLIL